MVEPGRAVGEPGVDPVPCLRFGFAVVAGVGDGGDRGFGPGLRFGEAEFRAVLGRPGTFRVVDARWFRQAHDAVGADPADQLDGQVAQDPGQAGDVVARVRDDHVRTASLPLACGDEPLDNTPQLGGRDRGRIVRRAEPDRVQDRGPGRGTRLQHGHEGVGPSRDELRCRLRTAVDAAEQPVRRTRRVRAEPRRHIDRQNQAPALEPRATAARPTAPAAGRR